MKKQILALLVAFILITSGISFAQNTSNGVADGTGPVCNLLEGTPVSISGTVAEIGSHLGSHDGIVIDTGTEMFTVYGLGSPRYWAANEIDKPVVGEPIVVDGYKVTLSDDTTRTVATEITFNSGEVDEETIVLRDPETGKPMWRGQGGKNQQRLGGKSFNNQCQGQGQCQGQRTRLFGNSLKNMQGKGQGFRGQGARLNNQGQCVQ